MGRQAAALRSSASAAGTAPLLVGLAAGLLLAPPEARALRIAGSASGVIAEDAETDTAGAQVFGLDGPGLLEQPFRIDFSYDPALAPPDSFAAGDRGEYESTGGPDWLALSITVNGHTEVLTGAYRHASVLDSQPDDPFSEDWLQLANEFFVALPDATGQQREFLDFIVFMPADTLSGDALPADFASDQIIRVFNSAAFRISDFELDPDTRELISSRYVSFNLDIHEISASPVPEPGPGPLLSLGVVVLGMTRRLGRSRSPRGGRTFRRSAGGPGPGAAAPAAPRRPRRAAPRSPASRCRRR